MEYFFSESFKLFSGKSKKGFLFGAGIGLISLIIAANYNDNTHLIAHTISGTGSLIYLGLCFTNLIFKQSYNGSLYPCPTTQLVFFYLTFCLVASSEMVNFENEMTLFFGRYVDNVVGTENGEGYFLGFIVSYAITCLLLSGFLETLYEALYEYYDRR